MSNQLATTNGPRKTVGLNVTSEQCVAVSQAFHKCGPALGLFGYWNTQSFLSLDGATFQSPYFQYFPPGTYTLVAADAWAAITNRAPAVNAVSILRGYRRTIIPPPPGLADRQQRALLRAPSIREYL